MPVDQVAVSNKDRGDNVTNIVDPKKHELWEAKTRLIDDIKKNVTKGNKRLNVVVIGTPGCGKSSFINTALTSVRLDSWTAYTQVGSFGEGSDQKTNHFHSFRSYKTYYTEDQQVLFPTFIDLKGLEDENDLFNKIFLRALFAGKIEEEENPSDLMDQFKEKKIGEKLESDLHSRPDYLKIDRIIVVASADSTVSLPLKLFECIKEVAGSKNTVIPVFGVMTKQDQFKNAVTENIDKRKNDFMKHLGINPDNFTFMTNYCPDVDPKMTYHHSVRPEIDVPVLKLLKQVTNPYLRVICNELQPPKPEKSTQTDDRFAQPYILCYILQIVLLVLFVYWVSIPNISFQTVNDICASYSYLADTQNITIKRLDNVCVNKIQLTQFPAVLLSVFLLLVILGIPACIWLLSKKHFRSQFIQDIFIFVKSKIHIFPIIKSFLQPLSTVIVFCFLFYLIFKYGPSLNDQNNDEL